MQSRPSRARTRHQSSSPIRPSWSSRAREGEVDRARPSRARPRRKLSPQRVAVGTKADPVMLEIFNNLFMSIAEQMGVTLQNTAYSVISRSGSTSPARSSLQTASSFANAPHMPVHLGSMDESVKTVIRLNPEINPGDVFHPQRAL